MTAVTDVKTPRTRYTQILPPVLMLGASALALAWSFGSPFKQDLIIMVAVYSFIALGMYIPFVLAGSMSMAYGAYAAVGGYALAIVLTRTSAPIVFGWLLGPIIAAAIAVVLGLLTSRLSGFFLAAATLLFSLAFEPWLVAGGEFTGGALGVGGMPPVSFFGWQPDRWVLVLITLLLLTLAASMVQRMRNGSWGVVMRTMRDVPDAVEAMGVRTTTFTIVSQATGAAIAALAGAVFVTFMLSITPETFTMHIVFLAIFMPIIGGQISPWGAIIGALLVVQLTLNSPAFSTSGQLIVAVAVLLILLVAPGGIIGYLRNLRRWWIGRQEVGNDQR